jgi:predicted CoA-substrate-specific enzyme activase
VKDGEIRDIHSSPKCAAGGGEFLFQQFSRMGLSPEEGIAAGLTGRIVPLAARCSVYCKSDATHKLNKGECTPADICRSLIGDLADKVVNLIDTVQWPTRRVLIAGGLALNAPFLESLRALMTETEIVVLPESHVLEAWGAALKAATTSLKTNPKTDPFRHTAWSKRGLVPLRKGLGSLDFRARTSAPPVIEAGKEYILGVDAGSTTTKAVLFDASEGSVGARVYLRTHGNPLAATQLCLSELLDVIGPARVKVVQAAVTGSGRELVAVHLNNCLVFNEILAHGRAAADEFPDIETVFEIGGQDSKFITFEKGVAVNYAMNDGCSAGTGSFLEESVLVDMGIPLERIAEYALKGENPVSFGERCAAFINTDLRNALRRGASAEDVVAGLIYSIAQNYLVKVAGQATFSNVIVFQGGVALNKAVGAAFAVLTGKRVVVPRYPEIMGCVGSALMVKDRLDAGLIEKREIHLEDLINSKSGEGEDFSCPSCENACSIRRLVVGDRVFPFGGLCSKYENIRLHRKRTEGRDLVAVRNRLMFEEYGPDEITPHRGTVGIPMALSTFEWFPFFARFFNTLGFRVVTSDEILRHDLRTKATVCYPAEVAHANVRDLLRRGVDHVFVPYAMGDELEWAPATEPPLTWEGRLGKGWIDGFFCQMARGVPGLLKISLEEADVGKLLMPMVSLASRMWSATLSQLQALAPQLGVKEAAVRQAAEQALVHYRKYRWALAAYRASLAELVSSPSVILAGHPYVVCSNRVNLALPRKIISRGYNMIPADMLPPAGNPPIQRNMWLATQKIENAIAYTKTHPNCHLCFVSCFGCTPNGMLEHRFRLLTSGQTYCRLEIDSHTAHAGFDTRIGAFLDILEQSCPNSIGGPTR